MPFGFADTFEVKPQYQPIVADNSWQSDSSLKQRYGIELAKGHDNAFVAACEIFGKETNKALWASKNWLSDPEVTKAKESYNAVVAEETKLLDREQLSRKLLAFAEEKILFNGNAVYAAEAKDRLAALKLFAEVQGYIGKNETNVNTFVNNELRIKLVEVEKKEETKVIDETTLDNLEKLPIKLKLVG